MSIERYIDYSPLKPGDKLEDVKAIIKKGVANNYAGVCVRPCDIDIAVELCKDSDTVPCCVLDFPHGTGGLEAKIALTEIYCKKGIKEIDMVMNYGYARSGLWNIVADEIRGVVTKAHEYDAIVKVIFEIGYLTPEEIAKATEVSIECGAEYIKTCTGFFEPVTEEAVAIMLKTANGRAKVKVSGPGIFDYPTAQKFLDMGAHKLGLGYGFADSIYDEARGIASNNAADPNSY
ncbi:deoxyribose-phosphate aldolase [Candidatus Epulonipiscium viviparus]|uniref:deoxyribose-phosphate aldolase n=2 Tax=Candidatus Epulonipiscium viviparus TaxID=420336 RepID=UPI0027380A72|nr:deoxyribose-phosphate aldolase [Candidatus Epulopiscium viviparus]